MNYVGPSQLQARGVAQRNGANVMRTSGKKRGRGLVEKTAMNIIEQTTLKKRKVSAFPIPMEGMELDESIIQPPKCTVEPTKCHLTQYDLQAAKTYPGVYMPPEYSQAIAKNLHEESRTSKLSSYFEEVQIDVEPRMRAILFGWLTEVHFKWEMKEIVLWKTFQIIDRYLATTCIARENFQMLGCAAIWVAAKFHEIWPPVCDDLVHMADRAFNKDQLLAMEADICEKLDYEFCEKTPFEYLERYTNIALHEISPAGFYDFEQHMAVDPTGDVTKDVKIAKRVKFLARYTLERWNFDSEAVGCPERHMAAVCLFTALQLTSNQWTPLLVQVTGFSEEELRDDNFLGGSFCDAKKAVLKFGWGDRDRAIITKYERSEVGRISTLRKKSSD